MDGFIEIYTPHGFHENVQLGTLFQRRLQWKGEFALTAVEASQQLAVGKDLCPVVHLVQVESTFDVFLQCRAVEDASPALVELLHGLHTSRLLGVGQVVEQGGYFPFCNGRYLDDWEGFGRLGQGLSCGQVLLQQVAQLIVFRREPAGFADGCVVVVGAAHGRVGRIVGAAPPAKGRTSVGHVQAEGNVAVEHVFDTAYHSGGVACLMLASPVVEPSAPELTAHQRCFGAEFLQFLELLFDIGAGTEVYCPEQVV